MDENVNIHLPTLRRKWTLDCRRKAPIVAASPTQLAKISSKRRNISRFLTTDVKNVIRIQHKILESELEKWAHRNRQSLMVLWVTLT